ncbi:MAG: hypothetical protein ACFCD0_22035 [Gemmataceae bacterium]
MIRLATITVMGALLSLTSSSTYGQGKNTQTPLETTRQDYAALARMKGISGRVVSIDSTSRSVTIEVEIKVPIAKPGQQNGNGNNNRYRNNRNRNNLNRNRNNNRNRFRNNRGGGNRGGRNSAQALRQQLQRLQQQARQAALRQRQEYIRRVQQLQKQLQQQARNMSYKTYTKEFTLPISSDVQVAQQVLAQRYDEKGFLKKYTKDELTKMKHPKLPGYKTDLENLMPGQGVVLYFGKTKSQPSPKKEQKENPKTKKPEPEGNQKNNPLAAVLGEVTKKGNEPGIPASGAQRPNGPPVVGILVVALAESATGQRNKGKRR